MHKIAFHLNNLEQGGAERVVSNLANQFAAEGFEVLVATEETGQNEYLLDPRVRRVHVGLRPEDEKKSRVRKFRLRVKYLRQFMEAERPDVLCAFAQRANYRALMAGKGTGVPVVISIRTDPVGHYDRLSDRIQIRLLFPRAAGCVFQTTLQREFFRPYLQDRSAIILNPIHPKYIGRPRPERSEKSVVQSARLVDFKNQPMLLDAFELVHRRHPDYVLRIYGGDSGDGTKEILERKIRERGAESYVMLMGACGELERELTKGRIYAFSSDWEGLPNALMEAMALGMPVVATDCPCGGPAEIIENGKNGLLVPIRDPEALAEGICRLIEDDALAERLGAEAARLSERASGEVILRQWRAYLETVSAPGAR
ncbi:glycosyltransferase [Lachnoclostridium sp. Marseille-P6806]|uniref:glycosyltransferase n=1 Tax=Lachnoclostridium sp. Marseille-P6806 TaxID=2364793 RepID=UPI00102FE472|nr:glycosyltransferase [Lachnoclostridium sp. Marseille-P6806]